MLDFILNHSSFLSVLAVFVFSLIYWYRKPRRFPPGPRGIPLLGYTPVFKNPHEEIYRLSKKYGPILSLRLGLEDLVFLNDFDSIYQVSRFLFSLCYSSDGVLCTTSTRAANLS